jgi:enterochelin esterase-like enzyme
VTIRFDQVVVGVGKTDERGLLAATVVLIPALAASGDHVVSVVGAGGDAGTTVFRIENPVQGRLIADSFHSRALDGRLRLAVYLPPGNDSTTRYPVIYFLHGLPGTPWLYRSRLVFIAKSLEAAGLRAIIVVPQAVRAGDTDSEYHDWGAGRDWETAIAVELPRLIDSRYRTIANRRGRALIGLSAGGYGAILLGLRHLATFSALESWSGYFRATDPSGLHPLTFGSPKADADASAYSYLPALSHVIVNLPTFIGFYVGSSDTTFLDDNKRFDAALSAAGVAHEFDVYPGGHDYALWQSQASPWLQRALQHLDTP